MEPDKIGSMTVTIQGWCPSQAGTPGTGISCFPRRLVWSEASHARCGDDGPGTITPHRVSRLAIAKEKAKAPSAGFQACLGLLATMAEFFQRKLSSCSRTAPQGHRPVPTDQVGASASHGQVRHCTHQHQSSVWQTRLVRNGCHQCTALPPCDCLTEPTTSPLILRFFS